MRKPVKSQYAIHKMTLNNKDSTKYLGVTINSKQKWKELNRAIWKKANVHAILAFFKWNPSNFPRIVKGHCYKALAKAILEYGRRV